MNEYLLYNIFKWFNLLFLFIKCFKVNLFSLEVGCIKIFLREVWL